MKEETMISTKSEDVDAIIMHSRYSIDVTVQEERVMWGVQQDFFRLRKRLSISRILTRANCFGSFVGNGASKVNLLPFH